MIFEKKMYENIGETVYSGEHESGLKVFVIPKKGFGKSYALFATKFGSINNAFKVLNEDIYIPDGVAHFLEHKLFEEPDGNVFDKFSKYGASANAYTSFDMTAYLFSATSGFYENLEILLDFVQNPYFTDENVSKEQGIIGQEINMYKDDANWCLFFNMLRGIYKTHPVRIDIAGSIESIAKIDKEVLYKCYNTFYNPANMVLVLVGDVDAEKSNNIIEKTIKKSDAQKFEKITTSEDENIGESVVEQKFSVARQMFSLGFKEVPPVDAIYTDTAYSILLQIIFGKSSPLYKTLYDQNLISGAFSASYSNGENYAFIEMSSETEDPYKARDLITGYVEELRGKGISEEDFERTKRSIYGRFLRGLNDIDSIAGAYASATFKGGDYLSVARIINNMTLNDINDLLKVSMTKNKSVLSIISPM